MVAILANQCAFAFLLSIPTPRKSPTTLKRRSFETSNSDEGFNGGQGSSRMEPWEAVRRRSARVASRFNTLEAAGIQNRQGLPFFQEGRTVLYSKLGFLGHSGLLLASTVIVFLAKVLWKTIQQSRGVAEAGDDTTEGVMDRCPWPFIFTHDPIQGIKDPPTWILIVWLALWKISKLKKV